MGRVRKEQAKAGASIGMNGLALGESALIAEVVASGELKRRLVELGYFEGERVTKVLVSPLGDPSAYLVRGTVTAIRNADAAMVMVKVDGGAAKRGEDV
ncbi:MAG: ferrous iron transport protein A [Clostridia bacterium]|nr:ferrous iron transport protein A [Clostridia bacterium]